MFGRVMRRGWIAGLTMGAMLIAASGVSANQTVNLHSGNGTVGGLDSDITMLLGSANAGFDAAFTPADFANARSGPQASIINRHPAWLDPSAFSDPTANWISTGPGGANEGGTALYAIDFILTDAVIAAADITFNFAVDNQLSDSFNAGLFLNGTALSGSTFGVGFSAESTIFRDDIAALLVTGLNTLYIDAVDTGGPSGLLFSATINTVAGQTGGGGNVPEPGALALFGVGLVALGIAARRRRDISA